jgi:hypothetical protein
MVERWKIVVELTFDIDPEDVKFRYEGDTEQDYSERALHRIKKEGLNQFQGEGKPFAHYHILRRPMKCHDS